ncbi:MAG TPA: hypothetical protein DCZ92_05000 [Elusimicrobia bacterium]|nr:hypothetical protein [Elusimicrobiota bacterium]
MAKILIVDDEETIRMLFNYVFADAGHEVFMAQNGREALDLVATLVPDAMLLDVSMPVMTGPEFAHHLRKLAQQKPELANIPYWVMTGEDYMSGVTDFGFEKDAQFKGYLPKMTPPEEVMALMAGALGGG